MPLCQYCGRAECRCGQLSNSACPQHGKMKIISMATWIKDHWKWTEYAQCMKCNRCRSEKNQHGKRTKNRKTL